ncbi:hypothetical protein AWB69_00747 [Caballeronia udeis]|uniref:Uncharacterized protein n=1 Tax=Caballeronia udeis TaxID=1232866 RepID=A0A158F6W3_9BURK|nr:hypothetical protein AWB69_00747 [Caballeronia udeis]
MNELLLWMSARRAGSAQAFSSKVTELGTARSGGSLRRRVEWNLAKLGHAEFAPAIGPEAWRVAPPVLAAGDYFAASFRAVLCGARTPRLMARLSSAAGPERVLTRSQEGGPDIVEVSAATAIELEAIATAAGVAVQWNAPLALLSCAIAPRSAKLLPSTIPVGGWAVLRFSKSRQEWIPSTPQTASEARSGLFRFSSDYETAYVVIKDGQPLACDPAVGKYRILRPRNRVIHYSAENKIFSIKATCRPPMLIERALVVCSGELPESRSGCIDYHRVEHSVARAVAVTLGQRIT